ncbi:MAG: class I SAM-dependent methyltransferase [Candidatus Thorarchaeota archaeon]
MDESIITIEMNSQTEKDIRDISELVDIKDKSILELGCGTGRITFALADRVQELTAIDMNEKAIRNAQQRNEHGNVTFLVEDIEDFDLGRKYDLILSIGVGYMYLRDLPNAIKNISRHLENDGIALLICSSPNSEYERIVELLVEKHVKSVSFYNRFENILSNHFTLSKKQVKRRLEFSDFKEILRCFQRELKEEYATDMNNHHEEVLKRFFQRRGSFTVEINSQAYICKHL